MAINNALNTATTPISPGAGGTGLSTGGAPATYVVSTVAGQGGFTSIQAAINQAVSDGASVSNPLTIWVFSGAYTENLTLAPFVSLACANSSVQENTATVIGNAVYSGTGDFAINNLSFVSNSSSAAISFQSAGSVTIQLNGTILDGGASGIGLECTSASSLINVFSGQLYSAGSGKSFNQTHGTTVLFDCSGGSNTGLISTISGGNCYFYGCVFTDGYSVTGASLNCIDTIIQSTTLAASSPCINIGASGTVLVIGGSLFSNAGSGFVIDGTGALTYSNIALRGSALLVDPALTVNYFKSITGNVFANSLTFNPTTNGIVGTPTNNNASSGYVGEYVSSTVLAGGAVNVPNSTATDITFISLTPGDWEVYGNFVAVSAPSTVATNIVGWSSTVSATVPTLPNNGAYFSLEGVTMAPSASPVFPCGTQRISIASTTSVYLSCFLTFTISTMSAYGFIGARRIR